MMERKTLSKKYLRGSGIEVGALTFPWPLANGATAKYIDRFSQEELKKQYPEHKPGTVVSVDIIDDGLVCKTVPDASQDFVLASHVLEHAEDPVGTLANWTRVTRSGGLLLLALPEKTRCFDRDRSVTPWEHVLRDFQDPEFRVAHREAHYREYLTNVDKMSGAALEASVAGCLKDEAHIHFHAWDFAGLRDLFQRSSALLGTFTVLEFHETDHEALIALRRI